MPLWGFRRCEGGDADVVVRWVPSTDPDDLLLPDDRFVPCQTADEALAALAERHPAPAEPVCGRPARRAFWHGSDVLVFRHPVVGNGVRWHRPVADLLAGCVAHGRLVVWDMNWSGLADAVRDFVYGDPAYAPSDLVVGPAPGFLAALLVRVDPGRAKARRTRAAGARRREAEKAAAAQAARAVRDRLWRVRQHVTAAAEVVLAATPVLAAARGGLSVYPRGDPYVAFWAAVDLRAATVPRRDRDAWRASDAVREAFEAFLGAADLLDTAADPDTRDRAADPAARAAYDRFAAAAKSHARRRARAARRAPPTVPESV